MFAALSRAGWPLFLVSNQPSCAKGKTSMEDLRAVHGALMEACAAADLAFRESYYCYHHPDSIRPELRGPCPCRKPSPHFLREAAKSFGLDLARSWMVGDQDMDVLCGQNAGCRTVLVAYPPSANKRGQAKPDHSCDDVMSLLTLL